MLKILSILFVVNICYTKLLKAQGRKLVEVPAYVIFNKSDTVPEHVLLIPADINDTTLNLEEQLEKSIEKSMGCIYALYFQSLRWLDIDLHKQLVDHELKSGYLKGSKYFIPGSEISVLKATLIFDTKNLPAELFFPKTELIELYIGTKTLSFQITDAPATFGYLVSINF